VIIRPRAAAGALALALLVPVAAAAQQQRNPFSDLFGRAPERSGEFTAVQFRTNAGAQQSWSLDNSLASLDGQIPEGVSAGADAMLNADVMRDAAQLSAHGRYSYREYRKAPAFGAPAFDAGVQGSVRARTRLTLQGGAAFAHSPMYQLTWLEPEMSSPAADRSAILLLDNNTLAGNAGIISRYTNRSSIEVSATYRSTDFAFTPQNDFQAIGGSIMWRRQMTRDVAVKAGYSREDLRLRFESNDERFTNERVDVGIEYGRALAFARRTRFSFGTDTSMLREQTGEKRFQLNGFVMLDHHFRRTWQLQVAARRGTEFLPGFRTPVSTDHANGAIAGHLAKRVLLVLNADAGRGSSLFDPRKFTSYAGDAKVSFGITRHLGLFTQYMYTQYEMPADPLTLFLVGRNRRQSVSFGVETWMPIYEKVKVKSDSR
jgi:hypothetical protein